MSIYKSFIRPLLFRLDPESAHNAAIRAGSGLRFLSPAVGAVYARPDPVLATSVAGLDFPTPLGLAPGYDKSGESVHMLAALGFGHVEIGSVSAFPSSGNPRPRLFRLPEDQAVVVHYGLPNDGAEAVAGRLASARLPVPLGINLVNTNRGIDAAPMSDEAIIGDYVTSVERFRSVGDYLALNLSCPNTRDGRELFGERRMVKALLGGIAETGVTKPVFLKISPLLDVNSKENIMAAAEPYPFVKGFILNLPPGKPEGLRFSTSMETVNHYPGAVSGPPVEELLLENLKDFIGRMDRSRYVIIASGGIRTARQVYERLKAGASLVQLFTALVYEGPGLISRINRDLAALMKRDGVSDIADIVGAEA